MALVTVVLATLVVTAAPNEARLTKELFRPLGDDSQQPMDAIQQQKHGGSSWLTFLFEMLLCKKGKSATLAATERQSYCRNEDQCAGRTELSCSLPTDRSTPS